MFVKQSEIPESLINYAIDPFQGGQQVDHLILTPGLRGVTVFCSFNTSL